MLNININKTKSDEKFKKSIKNYLSIMERIDKTKFDTDFKKDYCTFYRINPHRDDEWKNVYFNTFNKYRKLRIKNNKLSIKDILEEVLLELYKKVDKVELSFASKMLHTLYPKKCPIYDSVVAKQLNLSKRKFNGEKKIHNDCEIYDNLVKKIKEQRYLVKEYNSIFADSPELRRVSDIKKIDFLIWWYGKKQLKKNK